MVTQLNSVTSGILSARGGEIGAGPHDDFLQVDAPINSGNSGGPLFNAAGDLTGFAGRPIADSRALARAVAEAQPGSRAALVVRRGGGSVRLEVPIARSADA